MDFASQNTIITNDMEQNSKPLILVVDDIQKNLQVVGNILSDNGYEIILSLNGSEALDILKEVIPDLILLDIMMPEINGFETCRMIKQNEQTRDIPVIFLTAKGETDDIVKGFDCGGVDYLVKPFQSKELLSRIKSQIELKKSRETILRYAEELKKSNAEKDEYLNIINSELTKAQNYIGSLLPKPLNEKSIITDWRFIPSIQLGGDLFGYHWLNEDKISLYLIDVSGHGIGASLHSSSVLNSIRQQKFSDEEIEFPQNFISELNKNFQMKLFNDMFFTIWYGIYDVKTRILNYISCGHPPAYLFVGNEIVTLSTWNFFIGGIQSYNFKSEKFKVPQNSELYIYSDGVYEIKKKNGDLMTLNELTTFLQKNKSDDNSELDLLYSFIKEESGREILDDDFSIMKIKFV